ncbi:Hypothetical protein, putative primosome component [Metamycoplasma auris 15026]|uniref:Uncharacterized protein n=1 Tax=Metamycoplasma auris 15026 TaxID=1188233 RepID=N9V162_9BACT|nr:hypothetical protein [Metamycoplasma auris]ENY69132.1 Hypothetical protein, putative primosome component [Metamycoplasma auris 15026]
MDLSKVFNLDKTPFDSESLLKEVLSKDFIQKEIKRLNLSEQQIKKGRGILQRYHDFIIENNTEPQYSLYVNVYNDLAEDFSESKWLNKYKKLDNFWLTSITELDPIIQSYFDNDLNNKVFLKFKSALKDYLSSLSSDIKSTSIKNELVKIAKNGKISTNYWFWDEKNKYASNILKYIGSLQAIQLNNSVAILNANDLYSYISSNPDEKRVVLGYLNKVDILIINNLTLGIKPQWFLDYLINIIETRTTKELPILISSSRNIASSKTRFLSNYYYSKEQQTNDVEDLFKSIISSNFELIHIK